MDVTGTVTTGPVTKTDTVTVRRTCRGKTGRADMMLTLQERETADSQLSDLQPRHNCHCLAQSRDSQSNQPTNQRRLAATNQAGPTNHSRQRDSQPVLGLNMKKVRDQ